MSGEGGGSGDGKRQRDERLKILDIKRYMEMLDLVAELLSRL